MPFSDDDCSWVSLSRFEPKIILLLLDFNLLLDDDDDDDDDDWPFNLHEHFTYEYDELSYDSNLQLSNISSLLSPIALHL
jgi:hypothetical protein